MASMIHTIARMYKKDFLSLLVLVAIGILIIWSGKVLSAVGSRDIVKPLHVTVEDKHGNELPSVGVFVQLARVGNIVQILKDKEDKTKWSTEKVFIEHVMLGGTDHDLKSIAKLRITINTKEFIFSYDNLKDWERPNKDIIKPYIHEGDYENYTLLKAPYDVRLETSHIPIKQNFFSSLINWGGDREMFISPLTTSSSLILLYVFLLFFVKALHIVYTYKNQNSPSHFETEYEIKQKRNFIIYVATIITSIVSLTVLILLIHVFYKPDIALLLKDTPTLYIKFQLPAFLPEPAETLEFVLSAILSPFIIGLLYNIFKKRIYSLADTKIQTWYPKIATLTTLGLISITFTALAMSGFFYISMGYIMDDVGKYVFTCILFPLLAYVFIFKNSFLQLQKYSIQLVVASLTIITIGVIFLMNILNINYLHDFLFSFHFNPVFYPMSQVMAGKSLLVNITSLYGLFPFFLKPLFSVMGLSVLKFSVVMALLICLSYLFIFLFLKRIISNTVLLYCGFLAILFYTFLINNPVFPNLYYQYWPIRFIFPALFLFLTSLYFRKERPLIYYITHFLVACGVLWNFDSGIIVFIAWMIVLAYNELSKGVALSEKVFAIIKHTFISATSLAIVVLSFSYITHLQSGQLPNLSLFLQYQKMFMSGYFMIEMLPPPHSWNLLIIIYLVGLLIAIVALINKNIDYKSKLIFTVTILGVGLFTYFLGRSHDMTLIPPSYPAFILIIIFADTLYLRFLASKKMRTGEMFIFLFIVFILASAPFSMLYNSKLFTKYASHGAESFFKKYTTTYTENIAFIKKYSDHGDSVLILSPHKEGAYYAETGTRSVVDIPSSTDLFFNSEITLLIDFLKNNYDVSIFVETPLDQYDLYDSRIKETLLLHYRPLKSSNSNMTLFVRK